MWIIILSHVRESKFNFLFILTGRDTYFGVNFQVFFNTNPKLNLECKIIIIIIIIIINKENSFVVFIYFFKIKTNDTNILS